MGVFDYERRHSVTVHVGDVALGGDNPVRIQSMTNTSTNDIEGSVEQVRRIADAGADLVRLTAQGSREAASIGEIRKALHAAGYDLPLVADIHFNAKAAFAAAVNCEKVRINPGNFVDPGRVFRHIEYTDAEYAAELDRIREALVPLLDLCDENHTALRIGVNHGSLSDRIMSRYGDTPAGVVESAMEFLRVCRDRHFDDVVVSIKCSNTVLMVNTVMLMVKAMDAEDMHYPLHLGVTEAGDAEDGRIKSALGIGTLMARGIGDTIRVSLSEPPECEVPVARELAQYIATRTGAPHVDGEYAPEYDPVTPDRRSSVAVGDVGGDHMPVAVGTDHIDASQMLVLDADTDRETLMRRIAAYPDRIICLSSQHVNAPAVIRAVVHEMTRRGLRNPVIPVLQYPGVPYESVVVRAAADCGVLLLDGIADGIWITADALTPAEVSDLSLRILQAARLRFSHTEYISCPGCGRTLFDLQSTLHEVKARTSHLKGLKIGVMGCIVNGPGEMADADYGYVGAGPGNVSIYRGKECIRRNIPTSQALTSLVELLKSDGVWQEPEEA